MVECRPPGNRFLVRTNGLSNNFAGGYLLNDAPSDSSRAPARALSLLDTTSIIVGIIIGSAIYIIPPKVAGATPNVAGFLAVWIVGGAFAFVGSLCYAELATAYNEPGGEYVYLSRAFGRPMGFLFAWAQLWVVRPGATGAMAFAFQEYAQQILPLGGKWPLLYAVAPIVLLTCVNVAGVQAGKWTQNLLTASKVLGLLLVAGIGLTFSAEPAPPVEASSAPNWGFAFVMILFAYGGWNDMAYVAAEVKEPSRNILRSLLCGAGAVTLIYVLVNLALLHALGFEGVRQSGAIAAATAQLGLGEFGRTFVSALVCVSALGAVHGMIFTGSRLYYAMGAHHRLFRPLAHWNRAPIASLVLQSLVTLGVLLGFGYDSKDGFYSMVNYTVPVFWTFLCLVGLAVIRLRLREPGRPRSFKTPGFPLVPLAFSAGCAYMAYSGVRYAWDHRSAEIAWSVVCMAVGVGIVAFERLTTPRERDEATG